MWSCHMCGHHVLELSFSWNSKDRKTTEGHIILNCCLKPCKCIKTASLPYVSQIVDKHTLCCCHPYTIVPHSWLNHEHNPFIDFWQAALTSLLKDTVYVWIVPYVKQMCQATTGYFISKNLDSSVLLVELLSFWILSTVWYSKQNMFRKWICLCPHWTELNMSPLPFLPYLLDWNQCNFQNIVLFVKYLYVVTDHVQKQAVLMAG
jgi:hypothetical protein